MPRSTECPICGQPPVQQFKPFCSQGCRDRDLLRWLNEGYRVPVRDDEPDAPGAPAPNTLDSMRIAD